MALSFASVTTFVDETPNANSQATGSIAYTAGQGYLVTVISHLGASTNPPDATLSGWSVTWVEVLNNLWRGTGTNRGRAQTFWGVPASSSSGALTVTYTGVTLLSVDVLIDSVTGFDVADPIVETNAFTSGTQNYVGGATTSYFTMNSLASVDNRTWASASINGDEAALDFEANYTNLSTLGSGTAPTRRTITGWRNSATPDLTPAMTTTSSWVAGTMAIEIRCAASSQIQSVSGVALASISTIAGTAIASIAVVAGVANS